jgi:hypothetical protein
MHIQLRTRLRMSGATPHISIHVLVARTGKKLYLYASSHYFFHNVSFFYEGIAIRKC